jgi:hypothetical protein
MADPFSWAMDQPPPLMDAAKAFYGPSLGMLANLFQRPKSPGFLGESAADGAGLLRPGSILDSMFGSESSAPGTSSFDESGFKLPPSTNDPQAREPEVFADGAPLPRPKPVTAAESGRGEESAPLSIAPQGLDANAQGPAPAQAPQAGGQTPNFGIAPQSNSIFGNLMRPDNAPLLLADLPVRRRSALACGGPSPARCRLRCRSGNRSCSSRPWPTLTGRWSQGVCRRWMRSPRCAIRIS